MKKKQLGLVVSVVALVVALGAYFILTNLPQEEVVAEVPVSSTPVELNYLIKVDEENLTSVTVDAQDSYTIITEKTTAEGEESAVVEYYLAEPRDVRYLDGSFEDAADSMRRVLIDEEPIATENHSDYGLDTPSAVVTVEHADGTTVYEIGDEVPGGSGYYAKLADSDEIWTIPSNTAEFALLGEQQFRDKFLFGFEEGEEYDAVETFKLERSGYETILIEPFVNTTNAIASAYKLLMPVEHEANDTIFVEDIVAYLATISYNEIIEDDPQDLEQYGIPNALLADMLTEEDDSEEGTTEEAASEEVAAETTTTDAEATATDTEDTTQVIDSLTEIAVEDQPFARITINNRLTITLGDFTDDTKSEYYAVVSGINSVVTFPATLFPYLNVDYVDLMSSLLWLHNIVDASDVEISTPVGDYDLILNHMVNPDDEEDTWLENTLDGESIEEDFAKDIYLAVLSVTLTDAIEGEIEVGESEYTLTINMLNGDSNTMEFYRINERQYGAVKDGQPLPFYVNVDLLSYIDELIADIKAGVHES